MEKNKGLLLILTAVILAAVSGCSSDNRQIIESGKNITMYITTDIHYLAEDLTDHGKAFEEYQESGDGRVLNYIDEIVSAFIHDLDRKKPDILIISGDLTNNGEKESHNRLAGKLKELEETTGTSIYVIPGNHDIDNPWARGFQGEEQYKTESVSAKDFRKIYRDFGYGEAISRDKHSLSYLAAPSEDVWLLMLDTNEYRLNDQLGIPTTNGEISKETLEWIKKCCNLAKEKRARIITVMHHNLFNHSSALHYGFTLDNSTEAEAVFKEYGLNLILSGHIHIQDIKARAEGEDTIYDIATGALCVYPVQYGILQYLPDEGFDYSTSRVDVEGWAKESGVNDSNLLDFAAYSKNLLTEDSSEKAYAKLTETGLYTEEEIQAMVDTMSLLNINYFAGTTAKIKDEVLASPGYKLWRAAEEPEFLRDYVLSMLPNKIADNNKLFIPITDN